VNANVKVLTTDNFDQEVLQSAEPVLVDFWATWCPPCRLIAPTIEALADEYQGRVKVAKLDVDEHGELAGRYGVRSIPTLLLFKGGQVVEQRVGALPRPELVRLLDQHVEARASA
jgi:thioredoxin 1